MTVALPHPAGGPARMTGILWLASYPKSGNTWLRVFIANLFTNAQRPVDINALPIIRYGDAQPELFARVAGRPIAGLSDAELHALRPKLHHFLAHQPETQLVKTHNAVTVIDGVPTISLDMTAGAIYVLRNPFDLVLSYAHHFGHSLDDSIEALCSSAHRVRTTDKAVVQILGSWTDHYRSWFSIPNFKPLLLRYEDMAAQPTKTFGKVVKFLGVAPSPERLRRAIRFSTFDELKAQEARAGFVERARADRPFFRSGKVGEWRRHLSEAQVAKLVACHRELLIEQRYMTPDGRIRV